MPTCPSCLTAYPDGVASCDHDGVALVPDETFAYVDRPLEAGDEVGEYRIEGKLGEGGFGVVYRAVHPVIGKVAAIKVLSRQLSSSPEMVSRFVAEARAVNQIRHKNIIDVFGFGQLKDGRQYYAMELLEGTTFDAYLEQHGALSLEQALPILRGVARALDAAHAKGVLHRDLKPENVFLVFDEDGGIQPKLLDFGLVKLLGGPTGSHKTKTGVPMGTPYYMSPEQCRGAEVDGRTDVYSFGVMCFQVLTGEVPFDGETAMDVLMKHVSAAPPKASSRRPGVPPALDAPLARILAKEPAGRPATLGEALDALANAVGLADAGARVAPARAPDPPEAAPPARRREAALAETLVPAESDVVPAPRSKKAWIALAALAATVLVGGIALALLRGEPPSSDPVPVAIWSASASPPAASSPAPSPDRSAEARPVATADRPRRVHLRVEAKPDGAKVFIDGEERGRAPGPFDVEEGAPVTVLVKSRGYAPREITLTPTEDTSMPVTLKKRRGHRRRPGRPSLSPDLEGFDSR